MNYYDVVATRSNRKSFWDFQDYNEDTLDVDQDPRLFPSEANEFTLNESYSSDIDSSSFASKEDSSLDENNEENHGTYVATSTSNPSISREANSENHSDPYSK